MSSSSWEDSGSDDFSDPDDFTVSIRGKKAPTRKAQAPPAKTVPTPTPDPIVVTRSKRMTGVDKILHRIQWDPACGAHRWEVQHLDRFTGLQRDPIGSWNPTGDIPLHRIYALYCNDRLVWDRGQRIDIVSEVIALGPEGWNKLEVPKTSAARPLHPSSWQWPQWRLPARARILWLFGSFCPVHAGHLEMLRVARESLLDEDPEDNVFAVITPTHPNSMRRKLGASALSSQHRRALLELALAERGWTEWCFVDTAGHRDQKDPGARGLRDALEASLAQQFPDSSYEFVSVIGVENLLQIRSAFRSRALVVPGREDKVGFDFEAWLAGHPAQHCGRVRLTAAPAQVYSSTEVRQCYREGRQPPPHLFPAALHKYHTTHQLRYPLTETPLSLDEVCRMLRIPAVAWSDLTGAGEQLGEGVEAKVLAYQLAGAEVAVRLPTSARKARELAVLSSLQPSPHLALPIGAGDNPPFFAYPRARCDLLGLPFPLSERQLLVVFLHLVKALQLLHTAGVVHRDVLRQNLLLLPSPASPTTIQAPDGQHYVTALCDFGLSAPIADQALARGSLRHYAPEAIRKEERNYYKPQSDSWMAGLVIWELVHQLRWWEGLTTQAAIANTLAGVLPGWTAGSPQLIELAQGLLQMDWEERCPLNQVETQLSLLLQALPAEQV